MLLVLCYFVLVIWPPSVEPWGGESPYKLLKLKSKRVDFADGHEFSEVTRGGLLKILATFEEDLNNRLRGKKLYPLFTAKFGNNKYTKRFIYPKTLMANGELRHAGG